MNKNYKKAQKPVSRTNSKSAKAYTIPKKHILIILGDKLLKLYQGQEKLFQAEIVIGGGPLTPTGTFRAGSWVKDKIYPPEISIPWSESPWLNPYGPWFLPVLEKSGSFTILGPNMGIHGTRGPGWYWDPEPPLPESEVIAVIKASKRLSEYFRIELSEEKYREILEKVYYLYHSHGCIRLSNRDIQTLHNLIPSPKGISIGIINQIPPKKSK